MALLHNCFCGMCWICGDWLQVGAFKEEGTDSAVGKLPHRVDERCYVEIRRI
jgi:hypothetical protein